ncbi:hypothetical protein ACP6H6_12925 [Vibrio harveyi]|uniref:hypothetical protein n=2 Tax=Vibrio harveyi group TaxID=717610 RepID=UPI003CC501DD
MNTKTYKQGEHIDTTSKFIRAAHFISKLPLSSDRVVSMLLTLSKLRKKKSLSIECPMNANQVLFKWLDNNSISVLALNRNGGDIRRSLARYFNQPMKKMVSPGSWTQTKDMRFRTERVSMVFDGIVIQFKK